MFRDIEHAIVGGVCGGIGNRFNIPRGLVRVLFCATIFFFGIGLIVAGLFYLVLWAAVPAAPAGKPARIDNGAPPAAPLLALLALIAGASSAAAQCPECRTYHAPFERGNPAQLKAEAAAARLIRGHSVPGFPLIVGGCAYEGCGQTQESPRRAIEIACYWGEHRPVMIGTAKGRDGFWYSVIGYSRAPFPRENYRGYPDRRPLAPGESSSGLAAAQ